MSGSFYGLEIAKTGLFASRAGINVTGHNISNANTQGYTRQRILSEAIDPYDASSRFGYNNLGDVGGGVNTGEIDQIRNIYLDKEIRRENAEMGYWTVVSSEYEFVETIMDEMSDSSISNSLADFYSSLNTLSQYPDNLEMRTLVQQQGIKLTENVQHTYEQLAEMQTVMDESLVVTAKAINTALDQIAEYNEKISGYELGGQTANDLRDQRNVVLDELSELVNIEHYEDTDGQLIVTIEGVEFVNHTTVSKIDVAADATGVVSGQTGYHSLYYEGTTTPLAYSGGELEAYRFLRDENTSDNMGIPKIMEDLNVLARSISDEFNQVHSSGYTMPDGTILSQTGINFFENSTGVIADINASNFSLSAEVLADVNMIATSSEYIDLTLANPNRGNNENVLNMIALTSRTDLPVVTNFEDYLKSVVVNIAVDAGYSHDMNDAQEIVVLNLENRRQSISGVSIDEEMANLVKYEHSYSAASRIINAVDEALDILINRTGMVGR